MFCMKQFVIKHLKGIQVFVIYIKSWSIHCSLYVTRKNLAKFSSNERIILLLNTEQIKLTIASTFLIFLMTQLTIKIKKDKI